MGNSLALVIPSKDARRAHISEGVRSGRAFPSGTQPFGLLKGVAKGSFDRRKENRGVTASKVLFDTWAWWEVLRGSEVGAALQRRYLEAPGVQVLTAAISLGELSAKLSGEGSGESISPAVSSIRHASAVLRPIRRARRRSGDTTDTTTKAFKDCKSRG